MRKSYLKNPLMQRCITETRHRNIVTQKISSHFVGIQMISKCIKGLGKWIQIRLETTDVMDQRLLSVSVGFSKQLSHFTLKRHSLIARTYG